MGLCSIRPTHVPLLTKRHRQQCLRRAREHRYWTMDQWKRIAWSDEARFVVTPMTVSGCAVFQANAFSLYLQQVIHRADVAVSYFGWLSRVLLWDSRLCQSVREDLKRYGVSVHHCGPVAPVHGDCLPNKARICWSGSRNIMLNSS